jgi:hypothetical protein
MPQKVFDENSLVTIPYPPCSLVLAECDVWRIWHIKVFLADRVFNDVNELLEESSSFE